MRVMISFSFPTDSGNEIVGSGKIEKILQQIMEDMKPEAAYFYPVNGQRGGHFIVNMQDAADTLRFSEPLWFALQADVEITPVMGPEDMQAAMGGLSDIIQRYGS